MRRLETPRTFTRSLSVPAGVIAGLVVFALWMSIVGNPHVVETVLGLLIAAIVGTLALVENAPRVEQRRSSFQTAARG